MWLLILVDALKVASTLLCWDKKLSRCGGLDMRELTIHDAHQLFLNRTLTSKALTKFYIRRIHAMNPELHAVIEVNNCA
ncbi:hypothetical protein DSO57_1033102 [Entomophthora muscae]|uniref:Uncharacterized protein n=1 Tax=Entomophthora muscae TaxID=34485 RepID=A0ACC2SCV2_9FUNG|nr:hypothetical protein DSO57_1033102 [Entomophthora muscae]